jgi:hypothetical protein
MNIGVGRARSVKVQLGLNQCDHAVFVDHHPLPRTTNDRRYANAISIVSGVVVLAFSTQRFFSEIPPPLD